MTNPSETRDATEEPAIASDAIETEEFKLEMLDCGPGYSYNTVPTACFSCYCGSGCLCGCISTSVSDSES